MNGETTPLDAADQRRLLHVARRTAEQILSASNPHVDLDRPIVAGRCGGAFVTLWHGPKLRGCVGTFTPTDDLVATITDVTIGALDDPRFADEPVYHEELADIDFEISLLTDPTLTADPRSLVPGRHGIIVKVGNRSGCFLPKVASERGWTSEQFLRNCCVMKAGLSPDAWRSPQATVYLFEACSFRESGLRES